MILSAAATLLSVAAAAPSRAQGLGLMPGADMGRFSIGSGAYQAPDEAISDSGVYSFARYEIDRFEFEIDYGVTDQAFLMGAVDYLYHVPTAEGVTGTSVSVGGGLTFVENDPISDESKIGPNVMGMVRFMDSLALQLRYDLFGDNDNLWTFGLSYCFF